MASLQLNPRDENREENHSEKLYCDHCTWTGKKAAIYFCAIKKFHGKFNKLNNYYFYRLINPFASSQKGILWLFVPPIVTCEGHELINLIWKELVGFSLPSVYFHSYTLMTKQIMTERRGTLHDNCVDS